MDVDRRQGKNEQIISMPLDIEWLSKYFDHVQIIPLGLMMETLPLFPTPSALVELFPLFSVISTLKLRHSLGFYLSSSPLRYLVHINVSLLTPIFHVNFPTFPLQSLTFFFARSPIATTKTSTPPQICKLFKSIQK